MKKRILSIALFVMLIALITPAKAMLVDSTDNNSNKTEMTRGQVLMARLEEIKNADKSHLTRFEKRDLRKEVKSIRKEMKASGNGIYLSLGAIIIIVLLLILLL